MINVTSTASPIVTLLVSGSHAASERRFPRAITIASLKERLEPIVGVPAGTMLIKLLGTSDEPIATLNDDTKMLGFYPVNDYMRLSVIDTNPFKSNNFSDVSKVEKFEMAEDDYDKRRDTVRDFKRRHKIGRFADTASVTSTTAQLDADAQTEIDAEAEAASDIHVGNRCRVIADDRLEKRGVVCFVGTTEFKPGYWVGIEYDEPVGKHDGSVQGKTYFSARSNHGAFVRPSKVETGDYPEIDPFADEEF